MQKYILLFLLSPALVFAQPKFPVTDVPVLRNGNPITNAWVGGLNNPVISETDVNGDGLKDLFIYDKAGWKALVYLNTGSAGHISFTYAPQYERMFPTTLRDWAVMRDYNNDGHDDIFGNNADAQINIWRGGQMNDGYLTYTPRVTGLEYNAVSNTLSSRAYMWTFADNMPVIMDIDGDGAIDILAPNINGGINLNYYRNVDIDSGYSLDSLAFVLGSTCHEQAWGLFSEDVLDCGLQLDAISCKKELPASGGAEAGRNLRHQGGACFGFHYHNNDTLVSLILADILCPRTKFLENTGTPSAANITYADTTFPNYDVPVYIPIAPCAYGADLNNDGYEDLLFAPFASNAGQEGQSQDVNEVLYYQNNAIDSVNKFHYVSDTTITGGIDVGTESHPVFVDYNHDGLMDIVVGNYGQFSQTGYPTSYFVLYQNIGTNTVPEYVEKNTNWSNLTQFQLNGLYPAFGDLDGDGHPDMLVGDHYGYVSFFHNAGTTVDSFPSMTVSDWFGLNVGANAAPFIYDVNGDGLNDLVIGSQANNILYFWNFGTPTNPQFSEDSVNIAFGNIQVYDHTVAGPPPGYATPIIRVENGQTVLYTGSQLGFIFKYAVDSTKLRSGSFTLLDSSVLGTKPGLRSTVSIADINGDGLNDYLTGNIRGGLNIYSDANWGNVPVINSIVEPALNKAQMQLYPNPAKDKVICRLTGEGSLVAATVYNLLGETVSVPISTGTDNTISLSLGDIADGVYVIKAMDTHGQVYQSKIVVYK